MTLTMTLYSYIFIAIHIAAALLSFLSIKLTEEDRHKKKYDKSFKVVHKSEYFVFGSSVVSVVSIIFNLLTLYDPDISKILLQTLMAVAQIGLLIPVLHFRGTYYTSDDTELKYVNQGVLMCVVKWEDIASVKSWYWGWYGYYYYIKLKSGKMNNEFDGIVGRLLKDRYPVRAINAIVTYIFIILFIMEFYWLPFFYIFFYQKSDSPSEPQTQVESQTQVDPQTQVESPTIAIGEPKACFTVNEVQFNMVLVEEGSFFMGSTKEQVSDAKDDEKPTHPVLLTSYYIGETEVTQELWAAVMDFNPSSFKGKRLPVEQVSWKDCKEFITKLNQLTRRQFRLPTEAEWEFAARGGNLSKGYKYSGSNDADEVAWHIDNANKQTHNVATKQPNELGLYDMSGNVYEWCEDVYGIYDDRGASNPVNRYGSQQRVNRGGCWGFYPVDCRVTSRSKNTPASSGRILGLRLALSLDSAN